MHSSRLRHAPPHRGGAGKQQVIELKTRELRGHPHIALDHAELLRCKKLSDQFSHLGRGIRCQLTGFEHDTVARRQCGDDWSQRQLHRVVPRRDDAHHTQWLALYPGLAGLQHQRCAHALAFAPFRQMLERVLEHIAHQHQIQHFGPALRTHAKILLHGRAQRRAVFIQHLLQAQQTLAPHQQRCIDLRAAGLVLQVKNAMQVHVVHARLNISKLQPQR